MAYQVLARKWRPQTFAEVVGQEHIARTLRNAIINNRIGHAYLFVGSRGIGKTTSARIFAKALNCTNSHDGEPCCECENCREIAAGTSIDVVEFDAASHRTVDEVQVLREQAKYPPSKCRYKVFIIDEVHMLSDTAWNSLLKVLEEPPEYVKFLFATTEVHKVLPTIISRCQRFDLRRIPIPLIAGRLRQIAENEKIFVTDQALNAIARCANGGMRDAQSLFDQMIAFCGGMNEAETIQEQDVSNVFGLASGSQLREIAMGIFGNQLERALDVIAALADNGRDLERVFADLVNYIRNLMLAGCCKDAAKYLEVSTEEINDLNELAHQLPPRMVQNVLSALVAQERNFKDAVNKRIALEVILAQVSGDVNSVQLDDILVHLNNISGLLPKDQIELPPRPTFAPAQPAAPVAAPACDATTAPVAAPACDATTAPVAAPACDATTVPVAAPACDATTAPVAAPACDATTAPVATDELLSGSEEQSEEQIAEANICAPIVPPPPITPAPVVEEPVQTSAEGDALYRKATPEEFSKLARCAAAKTITTQFGCEPFDIRVRVKK
jgi:DNA polymerase III subunit gamma/tau